MSPDAEARLLELFLLLSVNCHAHLFMKNIYDKWESRGIGMALDPFY